MHIQKKINKLIVYNGIMQSINNFARMQFWNIVKKKMASQGQWENVCIFNYAINF